MPDLAVAIAHAGKLERTEIPIAADIAAWTNRPRNTRDGLGAGPGSVRRRTVRPRDFTGGRQPGLPSGTGTDGGTSAADPTLVRARVTLAPGPGPARVRMNFEPRDPSTSTEHACCNH